jgi:hypothetical protein
MNAYIGRITYKDVVQIFKIDRFDFIPISKFFKKRKKKDEKKSEMTGTILISQEL